MTPIRSIVPVDFMHLLFQMRSRLKSWCQSTTSSGGCCLASCCSGLFRNDKERSIRHLDKRQPNSFYTGLSQGCPGGSIGSTPGSGYPQLTAAKKSRTLGGPNGILTSGLSGNNFANTTSRVRMIIFVLFFYGM